jgi:hypothetical protein
VFQDVSRLTGAGDGTVPHVTWGCALVDLDNDGDMDLVINNLRDAPTMLRNEGTAPRLAIHLKGRPQNRAGIGARIIVRGGPVEQTRNDLWRAPLR